MILRPSIANALNSTQSKRVGSRPNADLFRSRADCDFPASEGKSPSAQQLRDLLGKFLGASLHSLDIAINNHPLHQVANEVLEATALLRARLEYACCRIRDQSDHPEHGEPLLHWVNGLIQGTTELAQGIQRTLANSDRGNVATGFDSVVEKLNDFQSLAWHGAEEFVDDGKCSPKDLLDAVPGNKIQTFNVGTRHVDDSSHEVSNGYDPTRSQPLVLIVDADCVARTDLEQMLERFGYQVIGVSNALTAIRILEQQRFDVCILGSPHAKIDECDLIQEIRRSPATGQPSIIVVAKAKRAIAAAEAIDRGADDYFEKPVDARLLHARISSCLRRIDSTLLDLSKFLPRNVLNQVFTDKGLLERPCPADVSVMVCDVRGFSRVSERVGPVQTIGWISDVMNTLSRIILDEGGTIVDYVGDEIMAMWGAPIASPEHATKACQCAQKIQRSVVELSKEWYPNIGAETRLGIGINSGLAVVGNTGSTHRVKYGPLGDTVNIASRVQGATKYLQSSVLITQSTASRIEESLRGRRVCSVRVHNIREPISLYELGTCLTGNANATIKAYEDALAAFEIEKHSVALEILLDLLLKSPDDGPAKLLMIRVIQTQLGGSFDPVWTIPSG